MKRALLHLLKQQFPDIEEKELYARILCGEVLVEGETVREPARRIASESQITFNRPRFVSRGGEKLEAALNNWDIRIEGKIMLDAGCSTGGFTDCLLQHGAALVHAVDVGYNQLDYRLRKHQQVMVHERTNIMNLDTVQPLPDAAVADLSFRSISGAASHILSLTTEKWLVGLVKPQFEWHAPETIDEKRFSGIIRDEDTLFTVLEKLIDTLWEEKVYVERVMQSPLRGRKGNREFFFYMSAWEGEAKEAIKERTLRVIKHVEDNTKMSSG